MSNLLINKFKIKTRGGVAVVTMSRQIAALIIRSSKIFVKEYPNATGCVYQHIMAGMSDDTDLLQGLPCYQCNSPIELGEECIRKRSNQSSKYYHTICAIQKSYLEFRI